MATQVAEYRYTFHLIFSFSQTLTYPSDGKGSNITTVVQSKRRGKLLKIMGFQ